MTTTNIDNDDNIQDSTAFAIHDNSSKFARFLPEKWIEPLVILARVKGYSGIDNYIIKIIIDNLRMYAETSAVLDGIEFQKYMHNMLIGKDVPNEWARKKTNDDKEDEEHVPHKKQQQYKEEEKENLK